MGSVESEHYRPIDGLVTPDSTWSIVDSPSKTRLQPSRLVTSSSGRKKNVVCLFISAISCRFESPIVTAPTQILTNAKRDSPATGSRGIAQAIELFSNRLSTLVLFLLVYSMSNYRYLLNGWRTWTVHELQLKGNVFFNGRKSKNSPNSCPRNWKSLSPRFCYAADWRTSTVLLKAISGDLDSIKKKNKTIKYDAKQNEKIWRRRRVERRTGNSWRFNLELDRRAHDFVFINSKKKRNFFFILRISIFPRHSCIFTDTFRSKECLIRWHYFQFEPLIIVYSMQVQVFIFLNANFQRKREQDELQSTLIHVFCFPFCVVYFFVAFANGQRINRSIEIRVTWID